MEEKLLAIADEVIALSASNEQIEVIAVHDQETDIRVYKGELESFTASESQGVGIRVVQDGRQGMAYAGSLDMEILKETLSEAREMQHSAPLMRCFKSLNQTTSSQFR